MNPVRDPAHREQADSASLADLTAPAMLRASHRVSPRVSVQLRETARGIVPEIRIRTNDREADLLSRLNLADNMSSLELASRLPSVIATSWRKSFTRLSHTGEILRRAMIEQDIEPDYPLSYLHRSLNRVRSVLLGRPPSEFGTTCSIVVVDTKGTEILRARAAHSPAEQRATDVFHTWVAGVTAETVDPAARADRIANGRRVFERYTDVLSLLRAGVPVNLASRHVGMHQDTFNSWHRSGGPAGFSIVGSDEAHATRKDKNTAGRFDSRRQDPEVAFLFGALCSKLRGPLNRAVVTIVNNRREPLDRVAAIIREHFPGARIRVDESAGSLSSSKDRFQLFVYSRRLQHAFNAHTDGLSSPPHHLLGTRQERFAFLLGYTTLSGSMTENGFVITKGSNISFLSQLALLFTEFDAVPSLFTRNTNVMLLFKDRLALEMLQNHSLVADRSKRDELARCIAKFHGPTGLPPGTYHHAMKFRADNPTMGPYECAQHLKLDPGTLRNWFKGGRPPTVKKAELLESRAAPYRKLDSDSLLFLYREQGFPLQVAKHIARQMNVKSVRNAITVAEVLGWDLKADPALIFSAHERYDWILKDAGIGIRSQEAIIGPSEVRRRVSLVSWAASLGISTPSFSALRQSLIDYHLPELEKTARWCWKTLDLRASPLEFDDVRSLLVVRAFQCLERFDPELKIPFEKYASSYAKEFILDEFGKMTKRGCRVLTIANAISRSEGLGTVAAVIEKFHCSQATAIAALGFARSGGPPEVVEVSKHNEGETIDLADEKTLAPDVEVERADLFAAVISQATRSERRIIDLHYREGLTLRQIARELKTDEASVSRILEGFLNRVRNKYDSPED